MPHRSRALRAALATTVAAAAVAATLTTPHAQSALALQRVTSDYALGDFEDATLAPPGWTVSSPSGTRVVTSSTVAISGKRALYVEDHSSSAAAASRRRMQSAAPGAEYHLQGYSFARSGRQQMALVFLDAEGRDIARTTTPTPVGTMVWSRVDVRGTAPAGAAAVVAEISSTSTGSSEVFWDAVQVIRPGLKNYGFEDRSSSSSTVPSWSVSASSGTKVTVTTSTPKVGARSLLTADSSTSGKVRVTSQKARVFPAVTHDLRVWVRPSSGAFYVGLNFLGADGASVQRRTFRLREPAGQWSLFTARLAAPTTAHWATVELSSSTSGTGSAQWDQIDLRPAAAAPVLAYSAGASAEPVDTTAHTNVVRTVVVNGRPKLVGIVSGSPAQLQVVDIQSNTLERALRLGSMKTGWAMTEAGGALYLGGNDGRLWRWAIGSSSVQDLGRATSVASTVWDLETAPDGRVWGVSYPDAELWSYAPSAGSFSRVGSLSSSQEYARSLAVDGTYAWVGIGSQNPSIMRVTLSSPSQRSTVSLPRPVTAGTITELDSLGRYLAVRTPSGTTSSGTTVASERRLYDTVNRTWTVPAAYTVQRPSPADSGRFYYVKYQQLVAVSTSSGSTSVLGDVTIAPGRERLILRGTLGGTTGTWVVAYDEAGTVRAVERGSMTEVSYPVRFRPTPLAVKTLAGGRDDLFVGGFGGSSLSVVDPGLGAWTQHGGGTSATSLGEVEGSIDHGQYQYIGTYTGAKIFRYDTTRPWSDGTNPVLVSTLGSTYGQDRPLAWATAGSRTFFGTVPKYGALGGVLGILDSDTSSPRIVREPVTDQSVVSLAASGDVVYGGTSRWGGMGATPTQSSARVFAYDAATRQVLWRATPKSGIDAWGGLVVTSRGELWAASGTTLVQLSRSTGAVLRTISLQSQGALPTPVYRNAALDYADGHLYVTAAGRVYVVDLDTLRVDVPVSSGITAHQIVAQPGRFFVATGTTVRRYDVE